MKTLAELEDVAQKALEGDMAGFEVGEKGEIICCPWLKWYQNKHGDNFLEKIWDGILVMQDWGTVIQPNKPDQSNKPEKLEEAV